VRQVADKHQGSTQRSWKRPYGVSALSAYHFRDSPLCGSPVCCSALAGELGHGKLCMFVLTVSLGRLGTPPLAGVTVNKSVFFLALKSTQFSRTYKHTKSHAFIRSCPLGNESAGCVYSHMHTTEAARMIRYTKLSRTHAKTE
jgi:hypothetical protein